MSPTNTWKSGLAAAAAALVDKVTLHTGDPGSTGANEIAGGSPAYARVTPPTATLNGTGQFSFQVVFNVPAGTTVGGAGLRDASNNFLNGGPITPPQPFASQGTYALTVTYQQN
jgi:hypothetical protein